MIRVWGSFRVYAIRIQSNPCVEQDIKLCLGLTCRAADAWFRNRHNQNHLFGISAVVVRWGTAVTLRRQENPPFNPDTYMGTSLIRDSPPSPGPP